MNDQTFIKGILQIGFRVFLLAWLVDIIYDVFAPADFTHFGYWTAVLMVMLFHLIVAVVRNKEN